MRPRKFIPTLAGNSLEDRALLSTFGGGGFDYSRPIVKNPALPVSAINFTSNTYHQIETSIGGVAGTIAKNPGATDAVLGQLGKITARVPFGNELKAILATDLQTLQHGGAISADDATAVVTSVFETVLGREPDAVALQYDVPAVQNGLTVKQLTQALVTSAEFLSSNTTDTSGYLGQQTQYVTALYQDVLGRDPEPSGLSYWVSQLSAGANPQAVATAFVNSTEAATSADSVLNTVAAAPVSTATYYFGAPNANGSIPGPFAGTTSQAKIADLIFSDLSAFLNAGEGTRFNVLKSHVSFATDSYLTFNGRVS